MSFYSSITSSSGKVTLNEAYFGPEYIKQIQAQFNKIREKFKGKPYNMNMGTDKDVLQFNRMMEQLFGFTAFSLAFSPSTQINAYAIPIIAGQTKEEKARMISALKAAKSGFRYDKMGNISGLITLNKGTIDAEILTDEEIIAIMLHELGHNFFEAVTDKEGIYAIATYLMESIKNINNIIKAKLRISMAKDISENDVKTDIDNICGKAEKAVKSLIAKPIGFIQKVKEFNPLKFIKKESAYTESMKDNMIPERIRYTNEKFADTFATMYGYGPALHSALMKMEDYYYSKLDLPNNAVYNYYMLYCLLVNDLLAYILNIKDEHPDGLTRIKVSCDYIRTEIAREGIDPKLKKELQAQLAEMEKLIEDYIEFPKDQDSYRVIRMYYTYLYKKFGGDRRETDTDNEALFNKIDSRYKELRK